MFAFQDKSMEGHDFGTQGHDFGQLKHNVSRCWKNHSGF